MWGPCDGILEVLRDPGTCLPVDVLILMLSSEGLPIAGDRYYMPDAPYVLSPTHRATFLETLKTLKFPLGYCSNLFKRVSDGRTRGLKSHDYHILLQQVLPCYHIQATVCEGGRSYYKEPASCRHIGGPMLPRVVPPTSFLWHHGALDYIPRGRAIHLWTSPQSSVTRCTPTRGTT
jgi:hypothetical protein